MNRWTAIRLRDRLSRAAGLLLVALPVVWAGVHVADWHRRTRANLEQLEARHARLLGIAAQRGEIDAALAAAQAVRSANVYPSDGDPVQTGNLVQQRLRDLLTQAGLQVRSSQVMPATEERGLDRIGLSLGLDGDPAALQRALAALEEQSPVVLVDELDIRVQGALQAQRPTQSPRLTVRLRLAVLRERA
jgi:general secretion pathway protein M